MYARSHARTQGRTHTCTRMHPLTHPRVLTHARAPHARAQGVKFLLKDVKFNHPEKVRAYNYPAYK
jgi:hypothetical protein